MIRLTYISTARAPLITSEIGALLRISRINNVAADITGLLVVGDKRFLQVLEGPQDAVDSTYARIKSDRRHFASVVLWRQEVERRLFPNWAMGCQEVKEDGQIGSGLKHLIEQIDDKTLRAQFEQFAIRQAA